MTATGLDVFDKRALWPAPGEVPLGARAAG